MVKPVFCRWSCGLYISFRLVFLLFSLPPPPPPPPPSALSLRSLAVDLQHVSKCRGVWSNTPRYFTNTCFRRRCPKRAVFRPFRQPALGRETNRPRNETPVVDLIYTPAGVPAFIIYASTDRELLNRSVKKYQATFFRNDEKHTKAFIRLYFYRITQRLRIVEIFSRHSRL